MSIEHKIWKIKDNTPYPVVETTMDNERDLEDILSNKIEILNDQWLLVGRQVLTSFNKYIDLLAIDSNGNIIIIELKKDKTPRDVVAQAIEYASWAKNLEIGNIVEIYEKYDDKYAKTGLSFDEAFKKKFNMVLEEENINEGHQIIIVAADMDLSTERIVQYLSESNIPINMMFFKTFKEGDNVFLSRAWFIKPDEVEDNVLSGESKEPWNGEFYVSYGEFGRSWVDAVKYGFVSGGGGAWYTQTLSMLQPGDRLWVNIPGTGYVGVGIVKDTVDRADKVKFDINGELKTIYELKNNGDYCTGQPEDKAEYIVRVNWVKTVEKNSAVKEIGFFGNQNTVCKPRSLKWQYTVSRLKEIWKI